MSEDRVRHIGQVFSTTPEDFNVHTGKGEDGNRGSKESSEKINFVSPMVLVCVALLHGSRANPYWSGTGMVASILTYGLVV